MLEPHDKNGKAYNISKQRVRTELDNRLSGRTSNSLHTTGLGYSPIL